MNAQQFLQAQAEAEPTTPVVEGLARVVAVDGQRVWLQADQPAACGSCATHTVCSGSHTPSQGSWQVMQPEDGLDGTPLAAGDTVRVGVDRNALAHASLLAYALPLLTMLLAAVASQDAGNAVAVAAAVVGLLGGAAVARVLARRWREALQPVLLGRASDGAAQAGHASGCSTAAHHALANHPSARPVRIPVVSAVSTVSRRSL